MFLIGVHFCIILQHLTILYDNKNQIFIAFLSYFSGPIFYGEEGPILVIFKGIKGVIQKPTTRKPKSGLIQSIFFTFQKLQLGTRGITECQRNRQRNSLDSVAKTRPWPRIRGRPVTVDHAIDPTAVVGWHLLLKAINRPLGPL